MDPEGADGWLDTDTGKEGWLDTDTGRGGWLDTDKDRDGWLAESAADVDGSASEEPLLTYG